MTDEIKKRIEQIKNGKVPKGYQKRFGLSPLEWEEVKLKSLCKKRNEKNKKLEYNLVLSNTAAQGVIRQSDYFEKDIANLDNIDTYFIVKNKDFVYNPRTSTLAPYGPIHSNDLGVDGVVSPLYTVFSLQNEKNVSYEYLKFYFESSQWNKYMYSIANYGARHDRMNIADKDFFNLPICLPHMNEQKRIAEILTCCEKVIKLKKKLLEEEKNQKSWLMQNLLNPEGKVRLNGFKGAWKKFQLCRNGSTYGGLTGKKAEDFGEGKPYIPYLNIFSNYLIDDKSYDYVTISKNEKQNKVKYGDIFFTTSSETPEEVGMSAVYIGNEEELYLNSFSFGYRLHNFNDLLPEFAAYFFNCQHIKRLMYKLAQGSTRYNLSKTELMKQTVLVPPTIEEQAAIANILYCKDRKINLLEQELKVWEQTKKALLQLLLTGIVRVKYGN